VASRSRTAARIASIRSMPPTHHTAANPAIPDPAEITAARVMLRDHLPETRLIAAAGLSRTLGTSVHLKLESELPTGSFKPRGALFALLRRMSEQAVGEVVASSTGNHGAAVAWAAKRTGVRATIYLPEHPNPIKRARIAELGARVIEVGNDLAAAALAAAAYARETGAYYLDDATDLHVPAGTATIGCEILEQAPDLDTIVVPMGDTALIRGVAAVMKSAARQIRVIGVQAATAPSYYLSWQQGEAVPTDTCDTIADGLATRTPQPSSVAAIRELVDDVVLVSDDELLSAMRHLLLVEHVVAEPAGAAATAAVSKLASRGKSTVVLVTGANIAPALLERVAYAS
jgi:threonine dehydratase